MAARVQREDFDLGAEAAALRADGSDAGALVTFSGLVRDAGTGLAAMELEHYPGMAERALGAIEAEARARWPLLGVCIIHRYGRLEPGEQIMMVATLAAHRRAAFEAADFLMDYLKTGAPFWKKEHRTGGSVWVEAKPADLQARARWSG